MTDIAIAAACNSDTILNGNLKRSPLLVADQVPLHTVFGAASASTAYNRALDETDADVVVFAHQDVYLPLGWDTLLRARMAEVAAIDPNWALLGAFGVGLDDVHIGPVWSSSLGYIVGRVALQPTPVQSYDEMVIVLRRASGLRFDDTLPGWHMYGTDIVTTARSRGLGAYAGALPCIHNDRYHGALGADFKLCYQAMQRKWAGQLPLRTPITKITKSGLHLTRDLWRARKSADFRQGMAVETDINPEDFARRCGWMDLRANT